MPDAPDPPVEAPQAEPPTGPAPNSRPGHAPKIPIVRAPVGACDAHVPMLAEPSEPPLWSGRPEDPEAGRSFEGRRALLREHLDLLGAPASCRSRRSSTAPTTR